MNKHGEIVIYQNNIVKLNGYSGEDRPTDAAGYKSFEFVELSHYYETLDKAMSIIEELIESNNSDLDRLFKARRKIRSLV